MSHEVRRRPLSISILGWLMVASGVLAFPLAFLRIPLSLFGMMLVGWIATAGILAFAVAYILIGFGLLRLKPAARAAGIAFFVLLGLNLLVVSLIPDTHAKMLAAMKQTPMFARQANGPAPAPLPLAFKLLITPVVAVPLWFLFTRKNAFE